MRFRTHLRVCKTAVKHFWIVSDGNMLTVSRSSSSEGCYKTAAWRLWVLLQCLLNMFRHPNPFVRFRNPCGAPWDSSSSDSTLISGQFDALLDGEADGLMENTSTKSITHVYYCPLSAVTITVIVELMTEILNIHVPFITAAIRKCYPGGWAGFYKADGLTSVHPAILSACLSCGPPEGFICSCKMRTQADASYRGGPPPRNSCCPPIKAFIVSLPPTQSTLTNVGKGITQHKNNKLGREGS